MAAAVTIYHNPRCSKSRATLHLLRERGYDPVVIDYLTEPPGASRIAELVAMLGVGAHDIVRTKETPYAALGLSPQTSADDIARAIRAHPILLERPIVVCDGKAAIGRPPERVLRILP
jgi:arsenate reductase